MQSAQCTVQPKASLIQDWYSSVRTLNNYLSISKVILRSKRLFYFEHNYLLLKTRKHLLELSLSLLTTMLNQNFRLYFPLHFLLCHEESAMWKRWECLWFKWPRLKIVFTVAENKAAAYISSGSIIVTWYDNHNLFSFPKNMSKEPHSLYTAFKIFFFVYIDCIFQIMLQLYRLA